MPILCFALKLYELVLIARIFMSWIRPDPYHPVVIWIEKLTDPVMEPVRRALPMNAMGIDFSPMIIFFLIRLIGGYLGCR